MKQFFVLLVVFLVFLGGMSNSQTKVINAGIGGNNTYNLLQRLENDVLSYKPDLVVLMVGTNDMLNHRKMISYHEYSENLLSLVEAIQNIGARVLLMSPPPCDTTYLYQRHSRELFSQLPNDKLDSASCILRNIAKHTGAGFIDLFREFKEMNLPQHNHDLFIRNFMNSGVKDGVHPTPLGYRFIAENVFQFLKVNGLLQRPMKIVCFGDSITFGSGVNGAGTVIGETYPAWLLKLINKFQKKS